MVALQKVAFIAGLMITTGAMIAEEPEPEARMAPGREEVACGS
jgi:hypothetical protein